MSFALRRVALLATLVMIALSGINAGAAQLPPTCDGTWKQVKPLADAEDLTLNDVLAVGPKDVWVVGGSSNGPVAIHWNGDDWERFRRLMEVELGQSVAKEGKVWIRAPMPDPGGGGFETFIDGLAWESPTTAWAAVHAAWEGSEYIDYAYIYRWNGKAWREAWQFPSSKAYFTGISSAGGVTWVIGQAAHSAFVRRNC